MDLTSLANKEINKKVFFQRFEKQVYSRLDGVDSFEEQKYHELLHTTGLRFFEGFLGTDHIEKLVVPQHDGQIDCNRSPDRVVKVGGQSFDLVISDFLNIYIPKNRFPKTVSKVLSLKKRFYETNLQTFDANFIYVSDA